MLVSWQIGILLAELLEFNIKVHFAILIIQEIMSKMRRDMQTKETKANDHVTDLAILKYYLELYECNLLKKDIKALIILIYGFANQLIKSNKLTYIAHLGQLCLSSTIYFRYIRKTLKFQIKRK